MSREISQGSSGKPVVKSTSPFMHVWNTAVFLLRHLIGRGDHSSSSLVTPERLRWTPELVECFWTGFSQTRLVEHSFARQGGKGLIAAIAHLLPKDGRILDFGAGDGEIIELMCERGLRAAAYEPSEGRNQILRDKLGKCYGFLGAVDMRSREQFDLVMMIEVIEHVLDEQLDSTLAKLAQFTRVGGTLIISTPNNEDLDLNMAYCPVSNLLFHRWQHVRSFTRETLGALLAKHGFEEIVTHELEFNNDLYVPYDEIWGSMQPDTPLPSHILEMRANRAVSIGSQSNLLYVGRRSSWQQRADNRLGITEKIGKVNDAINFVFPEDGFRSMVKRAAKSVFGRAYEPWIRQPFLKVRRLTGWKKIFKK